MINNLIKESWLITRKNFGFLFLVFLLYLIIPALIAELIKPLQMDPFFLYFITILLTAWLNIGFCQIIPLKLLHDEKPVIKDLFAGSSYMTPYLLASFIYFAGILIGLALLIVPGIIIAVRFVFFPYLIIDENLGVKDALLASWKMTRGSVWQLLWIFILFFLITLSGLIALGIGILLTFILITVAEAKLYLLYKNRKQA